MGKKTGTLLAIAACALLVVAAGCSRDRKEAGKAETKEPVKTARQAESRPPETVNVEGTVEEAINSGGFTFLRIKTASGEKWASVPMVEVKKGEKVSLINAFPFPNFYAKSLDRTFEELIFASGIKGKEPIPRRRMVPAAKAEEKAEQAASAQAGEVGANTFAAALASSGAAPAGPAAGGSAAARVKKAKIKVDRAPGANGFTVAEIFARAAALDGKKVVINGKVVKVSRGIMGRNWIHIQDGTGSPEGKDHDLVVTSQQAPEMDALVQVEGVLRADRDFGSGYRYAALVEDASFKKLK